ncbi:MAG TPA: hypothetical protein VFE50_25035 [Cyclobacteriaceae bacterium]|nr:hypothetical protein [Cyclobacteriaceae bacterium]
MSTDFHNEFIKKMVNQKLEDRVVGIIRDLDAMPFDIVANRELDKFYYMQKLAELKVLDDKLYEALERVRVMMAGRYDTRRELMSRWKRDVKWLALRRKEVNN